MGWAGSSGNTNEPSKQGGTSGSKYKSDGIMEQILDDREVGEGCKVTHAYICHLQPDELEEQRNDFWKQRMLENSASWYIICEAWHSDEAQAGAILEAAGFKLVNGTLEHIKNAKGDDFKTPIYCINDPINYSASYHAEQLKHKSRPEITRILTVNFMNAKDGGKNEIECENTQDVTHLKQLYGAYHDCSDIARIRLLYQGKELENDVCVDAYDLHDDIYVWGLVLPEDYLD
jgi:hypothetical protein